MSSEIERGLPPNAERLRDRAQERLRNGDLPLGHDVHTWGGRGSGFKCLVCDGPILESDVEFEVEIEKPLVSGGAKSARFHLKCHAIWDYERVELLRSVPE